MTPRRRRSGRRPRTRLMYEESFTFSIQSGSTVDVTASTLGNRPPRSNFRPARAVITASAPFVVGTNTRPGYFEPGAIQASFCSPDANVETSTSRVVSLGIDPTTFTLSYPRSSSWWEYDTQNGANDVIMQLSAVCMGSTSTAVIRGVVRLFVRLQPETIVAACPTHISAVANSVLIPERLHSCAEQETEDYTS